MYSMTLREAAGVAAVIVPWNSPVILSARSFAPALAAGCTVVMKMPAQTGLVNGVLSEIIADTPSLDPGVFNVFTESGNAGLRSWSPPRTWTCSATPAPPRSAA
ncbi:Gamma-aminobutyraldehyde dehydrogenase [Streptomyces tendae]